MIKLILKLSRFYHDDQATQMTTNAHAPPKCSLQVTIEQGHFYDIDNVACLNLMQDAFPKELERLKNAYAVERESPRKENGINGKQTPPTPSEILYGENFDEINRTLVGVLALRWIHNNDYETFTHCQPENVRLQEDSFRWLRKLFERHIHGPQDLFALVMSMVINDLGKDPNLEEDYYERTQSDMRQLSGMNHDMILLEAAKVGMVPCLDRLEQPQRDNVMRGLELGSELNAGQLAQAENVPINLEGLLHMRGHEHAFELKFMEQILDVAGASGHGDASCAKKLIEPVFQAFKVVYEVALEIIQADVQDGYDKVLTKRADMLHRKGYRRLTVHSDEQRALLRLLTMGRTSDANQAELFTSAFDGLEPEDKSRLVKGLNVDGNEGERAVIPYYMPAMLSEVLENTKNKSLSHRQDSLRSLMRYLGRVLQGEGHHSGPQLNILPALSEHAPMQSLPGIVIERNVMKARETISSAAFMKDPRVLDLLDIPHGQILQRRRTSQSI
jgi:hypothetical protein